jgi:hypothetical protein
VDEHQTDKKGKAQNLLDKLMAYIGLELATSLVEMGSTSI